MRDGARVVPMTLSARLTIDSVTDESGNPLPYIFETARTNEIDSEDADNYAVILPKALAAGEKFAIKTSYHGQDVISKEAFGGNYSPVQREDWYPHASSCDYTQYEMTFRIPKDTQVASSGALVSERIEDFWNVTQWRTDVPVKGAEFNFGLMNKTESSTKSGTVVASYTNNGSLEWIDRIQRASSNLVEIQPFRTFATDPSGSYKAAMGTPDKESIAKQTVAQAAGAIQFFTDFFGPMPYKRVSITQQVGCDFGHSWPGLVWLPICSFYNSAVRRELGFKDAENPYWMVATPHEIAHQWWGQTVGGNSYRDQWMDQGLSEFSAALFLETHHPRGAELYRKTWTFHEKALQEKNKSGYRLLDAGPLALGGRASGEASGAYRDLANSKGAFVLHMLRMMMWQRDTGDKIFKNMLQDFVKTYSNKPASVEEFKTLVEKHMLPIMNLDGNKKMDWFFNEWVYGTEVPKYDFVYSVAQKDGKNVLHFTLKQSAVSEKFKVPVPIYVELAEGNVAKLGFVVMEGSSTKEQDVVLGEAKPKKVLINYNFDVLSQ